MAIVLKTNEVTTGYGKKQVLYGVSIEVGEGEVVAIIGPNGAGKSTVLKAICGLLPTWDGTIHLCGVSITGNSPVQSVARGVTFAPQGSRVFQDMTVMENLEIGGIQLPKVEVQERIAEVLELFPILKERLRQDAGRLSGGEQQMVALARALVPRPKLLMLDEPSLGLGPNLVKEVLDKVVEICHNNGIGVLVVEQKVREILEICDRVYSLKLGRIAYYGSPDELMQDRTKLKRLFL